MGQGILRCLKLSGADHFIVTADPNHLSSGHLLGNKAYTIPVAKDPNYVQAVKNIIVKEQIQIVLIGTDIELPKLSAHQSEIESATGAKIIVAPVAAINIANDKWLTAEYLRENSFPYPQSALAADAEKSKQLASKLGFPLIVKPADGARSVGFEIIKNQQQLDRILSNPQNFVIQEYLADDEGEFTSGCVVYDNKCVAIVTLRRDLRDGNTFRTYRNSETAEYDYIIKQVAEKLQIEGPCNFQFRIKNGLPVIFEINCRFSGTTPLRAFYGFNEVEAIVAYVLQKKEIKQPALRNGIVLRTYSDVMVTNESIEEFERNGQLDQPVCEQFPFIL